MIVVGIKFRKAGKIYYFDPKGSEMKVGDGVVVETVRGIEFGRVELANFDAKAEVIKGELKPIIRKATSRDEEIFASNVAKREECLKIAKEKIEKNGLSMKIIDCEYTFDGSKIIFYFTADSRVDFRELVRDLASVFRVRIELRQVGIRDETKTIGGLASCGRPCCCSYHLPEFVASSIKMAKTQGLSLNPQKISGLCGRLMCCLQYENEHYTQTAKLMPKIGSQIDTPDGMGIVENCNMLTLVIKVKFEKPDGSFEFKEYTLDKIKAKQTILDVVENDKIDDDLKKLED